MKYRLFTDYLSPDQTPYYQGLFILTT